MVVHARRAGTEIDFSPPKRAGERRHSILLRARALAQLAPEIDRRVGARARARFIIRRRGEACVCVIVCVIVCVRVRVCVTHFRRRRRRRAFRAQLFVALIPIAWTGNRSVRQSLCDRFPRRARDRHTRTITACASERVQQIC